MLKARIVDTEGKEWEFTVREPRSYPISDDELKDKWESLTAESIIAREAERLFSDLRSLVPSRSVRELVQPLSGDRISIVPASRCDLNGE